MAFLRFLRTQHRHKVGQPAEMKSFGTAGIDWLRGEEPQSVFLNAYQQIAWVYRAINVLAEQVANIPFLFSIGERGRETLLTGGPVHDFYERPHPQIDRFQYWELRIIWLMLRGECFRVPIFESDSAGRSRRLSRVLILDPAHFQHVVHGHQLVGWRYTGLGSRAPLASQVFLPEEVWFEKLPNPFDFWRGLPPLYAAANAARTDFAAAQFMRGIIENNADAGVIIRTDQPLDPEQQEQLFAALRERKRKAGTADRPVLLSGCSEVIKPQLSSTDLQFLENRKFSRAEICAAFGVPEEIVTSTDSAKYDVMRGARLNFIENRVAPLCGRLEAAEQLTVRSLEPRAVGWFDLDSLPILQEARRQRLVAARTGFEMGIPLNELNRVLDLGFKALPWGNAGFLPTKFQRLGEASTTPQKANPALAEVSEGSNRWPDRLQTILEQASSPEAIGKQALFNARRLKLQRYFFEQRCRVLARLEASGCNNAHDEPGEFFPLEHENAELDRIVDPWMKQDFYEAAGGGTADLNLSATEGLLAAFEAMMAAQRPTVHKLNREIARAVANAVTPTAAQPASKQMRAIHNGISAEQLDSLVSALHTAAISTGRATVAGFARVVKSQNSNL